MSLAWNKTDGTHKPSMEGISDFVNNILWDDLCHYIETQYQTGPEFHYSRCSMQMGWNVKFKKAGRALCTLYPMEGYYRALIVIGEREQIRMETNLPNFTPYVQELYQQTKSSMGQKWLMLDVTNQSVLKDLKDCINFRREKI